MTDADRSPVVAENPEGAGPFVIVCDHASNRIPEAYRSVAVGEDALETHVAWDLGALKVAQLLAARLDAPLFWPDLSRLVIDCNRDPAAPDLIVTQAEGRPIPGNQVLREGERSRRLAAIHAPYHAAIDACLSRRAAAGQRTAVIAIHSFTPVYSGKARPWEVGVIVDNDRRLADAVIRSLKADPKLTVGVNEPYAPADGVYYTLRRHAGARGLPAVMIEIRSDQIEGAAGQKSWADRLAEILETTAPVLFGAGHAAA